MPARILAKSGKRALLAGFAGGLLLMGSAASAQSVVATGVGTPFELAFWQSIDSSSDPSLYEAYLARFPNGTFSEIARVKITALHGRISTPPAPVATAAPPPPVSPALTVPVAPPATSAAYAPAPAYTPPPPPPPPAAPPAYARVETAAPAVAAPVAQPAVATAPAAGAGGATLGQLLAALGNSQMTGTSAAPAAPTPPPPPPVVVQRPAGFAVPPQPGLVPVASVALPPSFCSVQARNAFHDAVYQPAVMAAKANNDAAVGYMRQLQSLYDQYQLSHEPETMNAIVGAAREYQQVAQTTFSIQAALVRQFSALMAVPVVACSLPGQPAAATLAK